MADWSALPMMLLLFIADLLSMVGLTVLVVVVLPAGRGTWCTDNAGDNGVKAAI